VREIARIVAGRPDPAALDPLALPTHPGEWLETAASVTGLLAPDERATVVALRGGAERLAPLADDEPALGRGLALLRATERFEPGPTPYDGAVGTLAVPQTLSVSALETLGGCPLRFFFSRVLRVGELREPASPWLLEPREMGTIGHRALELVYRRLRDDGLFDGGDADAAAVRAAELIPRAFDEAAGSLVARLRRRLPVLWDGQRAAWLAALAEFTRADLARLVGEGWRPVGLERPVEREVDFDGRRVVLRGRFDREMTAAPDVVDTSSDGRPERLIGDYKTTKDLARLVSERAIVRGHSLQMPLYRELAGAGSSVEVLRIGPAPEGAGADPAPRRIFEGFGDPAIEAGFRETLAVLLDLVRRGRYPLRPDAYVCGELCAYERACRRGHPPTLQRETRSPDVARYYRLSDKTDKLPLLDPAGGDRP